MLLVTAGPLDTMNPMMDNGERRRQMLNPLTTQMNHGQPQPQQYHPQTPGGALSSPFQNQAQFTPQSAVRYYNPQQWNGGPNGYPVDNGGRYSPAAADVQVPAPPPYSPPRSNGPTSSFSPDANSTVSPMTRSSPDAYRPSPEPPAASFPPPPGGAGGRQRSRDRAQPLLSHLGNVFHRKPSGPSSDAPESAQSRSSIDFHREHGMTARRPPPLTIEPIQPEQFPNLVVERPPSSRRAASASAIVTPTGSRSRNSSTSRWEPGMPLPPPPPGPPPQSSSRSQSLTRDPSNVPIISPPTRRPQTISNLGPIPPTPAGWVDSPRRLPNEVPTVPPARPVLAPLNTGAANSDMTPPVGSGSGSAGFSRSNAVRGEPKSIRERRSASRSGKAVATDEPSNNPWADAITPSDIVVPPMTALGRRPTVNKSTPRSGRFSQSQETPGSGQTTRATPRAVAELQQPESRESTPRPLNSSHRIENPTPPFSPDTHGSSSKLPFQSQNLPPKSLPTPPPMTRRRTGSSPRPISHILHTPLRDEGLPPPLSPAKPGHEHSKIAHSPAVESFCRAARLRHDMFVEKEASAASDEERIRLFAEFIVSESRIRRERYAGAIHSMGSEVLELTRDLFRPYSNTQPQRAPSFSKSKGHMTNKNLPPLQTGAHSDSTPSSSSSLVSPMGRPESQWWTGYMPSLSPIPSMTASQAMDESSSRGRPSSRWWEVGQSGSGGSPTVLERSKRESKYMGMPKELREQLQWGDNAQSSSSQTSSHAAPSTQRGYGPNEYPPEKVGWHEEEEGMMSPPQITPTPHHLLSYASAPATPDPRHLDVSRLVTLPPPYPRHFPAVNNNHPDLTSIRVQVRTLSDFTEVEKIKEQFHSTDAHILHTAKSLSGQRMQALRVTIQREISSGAITYADAARREEEHKSAEAESTKASTKASFELFQSNVVAPVNDLLMDRVIKSTELFEQLRGQLFVDANTSDPNVPQEEGDEKAELLEKLTLLKWIFEAREGLHKELFELLSERNDRYRDMVIEPYRLANRADKIESAMQFFAEDALKRKVEFEQASLQRTIEFQDVVEANVVRGVEVQLSAFWDIAPGLVSLIEKIPKRVTRDFRIQIPAQEYNENPQYAEYPLQYLYSLLEHSGKSTYQFMESQINLLCLLHEVKNAVAAARIRMVVAERVKAGEKEQDIEAEMEEARKEEERVLTEDLKEKVRTVEEQWGMALGKELEDVKRRVRGYLEMEGGWEGMDDET